MKLVKPLSIMLVIFVLMSCTTLPNASNVKTPDGEATSCVMPNGTITDLYMFKSLKDGHYYSWYVINDMMDLFQNPINNFSSSDRKDFTSLKPVNKQGVFQDKYSAGDLGELADYMQTNGFSCGFWHEIRGGKMIIAEVWTENNNDYMYRELACPSKIEALIKEIEARIAKQQPNQVQLSWVRAIDSYNDRARLRQDTGSVNEYGANAGPGEIKNNKEVYIVDYVFAGGSVGLTDSEGNNISTSYIIFEPQIRRFKTFE